MRIIDCCGGVHFMHTASLITKQLCSSDDDDEACRYPHSFVYIYAHLQKGEYLDREIVLESDKAVRHHFLNLCRLTLDFFFLKAG